MTLRHITHGCSPPDAFSVALEHCLIVRWDISQAADRTGNPFDT
ncbi:hypothetical protein DP49_5714 [Burkholderia pseudomallei]|nr:hypothetical protein DP49_5714 [Burkholderia pseudomallei]